MTLIKAIDTAYAGHLFRSRIEARWAIVLDTANIPWEYEAEGYELGHGDGWYLPDFYLPTLNTYLEVKGTVPTDVERRKLLLLCMSKKAFGSFGLSLKAESPFDQWLGGLYTKAPYQEHGFEAPWPDGLKRQEGFEVGPISSVPTDENYNLDCPICRSGDGCAHTGDPIVHGDDYPIQGLSRRGPITEIPVNHECCDHEWSILIAFHKGNTQLCYHYPRATGMTPLDTVMASGVFSRAFRAGREARFEHGANGGIS